MLRTPAPLKGALDVRKKNVRSFRSQIYQNRMEASHRHVAFEMSFATRFIGAAANGRESINKIKIVVWPPNTRAVP